MLNYAKKLHRECLVLASRLKFNKALKAVGLVVCFYGRLIELTGGMIVLIDEQKASSAPIVFRSFLEAYVDLINLMEDANYIQHLLAAHHKKWIKILGASRGPNPYLESIGEHRDVNVIVADHTARLEETTKAGYAPLKVWERFQKANMENEYRSIYSFGSGDAHNDFGALMKYHIAQAGDDFQLVFYREVDDNDFAAELDSIAGLLLNATLRIHNRLKSGCDEELQKLDQELGVVWDRMAEGNRKN